MSKIDVSMTIDIDGPDIIRSFVESFVEKDTRLWNGRRYDRLSDRLADWLIDRIFDGTTAQEFAALYEAEWDLSIELKTNGDD